MRAAIVEARISKLSFAVVKRVVDRLKDPLNLVCRWPSERCLPEPLVELLAHKQQDRERARARQLWEDGDWVLASEIGQPLNPSTDYHQWKDLLSNAGVRDGRLHDAHTAATVLLLLGVPERAVMGIMGRSTTAMAARYQHMIEAVRRDIADRVGGLIWAVPDLPATSDEDDEGDGSAGVQLPA